MANEWNPKEWETVACEACRGAGGLLPYVPCAACGGTGTWRVRHAPSPDDAPNPDDAGLLSAWSGHDWYADLGGEGGHE